MSIAILHPETMSDKKRGLCLSLAFAVAAAMDNSLSEGVVSGVSYLSSEQAFATGLLITGFANVAISLNPLMKPDTSRGYFSGAIVSMTAGAVLATKAFS